MKNKWALLESGVLLMVRFVLAFGFFMPAKSKWIDIQGTAEWFGSMHIPFPFMSAVLAASVEALAVVLLPLGLFTRLISLPLIFTMGVAIATVHAGNGFNAGDNGWEIPLYYILFLSLLLSRGSGSISLDFWFRKNATL